MVPQGTPSPITSPQELAAVLDHIRSEGIFAYDTEFIGEETYFPQLCLVQLATAQEVHLVDPMAITDLKPLWELIIDPNVRTLVHAGHQDLEPIFRLMNTPAANVIDTQIAAGLVGMPYPCSLNRLVLAETGAESGKGMTFTRWDNRPLSAMQCRYAADDVRYLPLVWSRLEAKLAEAGHLEWAQQECQGLCEPESYRPDFEAQGNRLQRNRTMRTPQRAMLYRLLVARDESARESNVPPRTLMADEVVMGLLKHRPGTIDDLTSLPGMPRPVARKHGQRFVDAIQSDEMPTLSGPKTRLAEETVDQRVTIDGLWAAITASSLAQGVAPALLCSRSQIAKWYLQGPHQAPLEPPDLPGWRGEFMRQSLGDFLAGERTLDLAWRDGRLSKPGPAAD